MRFLPRLASALALLVALLAGFGELGAQPQESARLVAILPGTGAPTLVGESGQLYEPSANMQWRRKVAGGVSVRVERIYRSVQGVLYAVGQKAPLFQMQDGAWSMYSLVRRGSACGSSGDLPIFAVERSIYELGQKGFHKIASAKASVKALWASSAAKLFVITGDQELWTGGKTSWKQVPLSLGEKERVVQLAGLPGKDALLFTSNNRLFQVSTTKATEIPMPADLSGFRIHTLGAVNGRMLLAGELGSATEQVTILATVEGGSVRRLSQMWALGPEDRFALIAPYQKAQVLVASYSGQLGVLNEDGSWQSGRVDTRPPEGPALRADQAPALAH